MKMKTLKCILWICCFSLALYGCTGKQTSTLSFDIRDYDGTAPRVTIGSMNRSVTIDSVTGQGSIELDIKSPVYATVSTRKFESKLCFLEPGKDLKLTYSMKPSEKEIKYGGALAQEAEFLNQPNFYNRIVVNVANRGIQAHVNTSDSILMVNRQKLDETTLSKTFKQLENKRLLTNSLLQLLRVYTKDTTLYLQTLRERVIDDSTFMTIPAYREFLDQYIRMLVRTTSKSTQLFEGTELADRRLECIFENMKDPAVLSYLVDITLFHFGAHGIEKYNNLYRQYVKDPERLALFAEACKKAEKIAPGQPCPDFSFQNNKGETVTLADLKGKFVYLDIWATWCGPCKGEMPSLLELEKRFEGKDILFVSLSVDKNKDIELWKQTIEKMGLGGIQLHLGENWAWLKNFMPASMSVPRFILLDRKGKIIDANMSRPSDKATAERFHELLNAKN